MTDQRNPKRHKLAHEILGLFGVVLLLAVVLFHVLFLCSIGIVQNYCAAWDIILNDEHLMQIDSWAFNLSLLISVGFFIILFLFLLGERLSYIGKIMKGIDTLRMGQLDYELPLEGQNELTQLAEAINYMSATQKQIKEKERVLNEEKEQLIRTLSHDIRTPLTSIMAYTELLTSRDSISSVEGKEYLELIQKKAQQIGDLTDILLDGGRRNPETFEDARLLMEQLADEFEEALDGYRISVELPGDHAFAGTFDVQELRRIFDNLISNVRKYADPQKLVTLQIGVKHCGLVIRQENARLVQAVHTESYQMGLNSIRRIAHNYGGQVEIKQDDNRFEIVIILSNI